MDNSEIEYNSWIYFTFVFTKTNLIPNEKQIRSAIKGKKGWKGAFNIVTYLSKKWQWKNDNNGK